MFKNYKKYQTLLMTILLAISALIQQFCNENWDKYLGDCNIINTFLKDKPKNHLLWSSLRFVNVYFRSLGQVLLVTSFKLTLYNFLDNFRQ